MKRKLPDQIAGRLRQLGFEPDDAALSLETDINEAGHYELQWLVAFSRQVFVFDPRYDRDPVRDFTMDEIEDFRTVHAVGSGLLQVKSHGVWFDLLRYSNTHKYTFDRALRRLQQLKRGEPLTAFHADEIDPQRCTRCGMMLEAPGELCLRCLDRGAAMRRMVDLMKPYWRAAFVLVALLVVGIALDMAWPLLTRYLVDHVLTPNSPVQKPPFAFMRGMRPKELLVVIVVTLAGVHVLRAISNVVNGRLAGRVGNEMIFDVRGRMVKKLEQLSLAFYGRQDTGSLVGRVAYDTDAIQSFITQLTSGFVMQFLLVVISFVMMFLMEPSLALWALVPAPLVLGGALVYWRFVHPQFQRFWHRSSKQASVLNGMLSGIRVVKAFAQEETEFLRFQKASSEVRNSRRVLDQTSAYFYPVMGIVFQVGGWIIWYVGGLNVLSNDMSLGTLMAFFGYLSMFYGPLGSLTNLTTWFTQFSTQVHRIFEILDAPTVLPEPAQPVFVDRIDGHIEFRDVTFGYARGSPVLENLNFVIQPREKIGIVGRSGSGKTSMINLLARFYDVDSGSVLVDGIDVRNLATRNLRTNMALVLQEPFLFRGNLVDNIAYARAGASIEDILQASRSANCHEPIMNRPLAYDSSVGERGSELSGGERQRISIARALLCHAPILVLDEATSSIDSESELAIQAAIDEASRKRTTIIIAHRLSTVKTCDRIYVVEDGRIVETGNHSQLMAVDGRYARWVRIQQGEGYGELQGAALEDARKQRVEVPDPHVRWLQPGVDHFKLGPRRDLQLVTGRGDLYVGVFTLRCFPIHHPDRYISVRFIDPLNRTREIGLVSDLNSWPKDEQGLIKQSLARRYFFHHIHRVKQIEEFAQFLMFTASTDLGDVEFTMRYSPDAAQDVGPRGRLLVDVEDNLYVLPDLSKLPWPDRNLISRYIYW